MDDSWSKATAPGGCKKCLLRGAASTVVAEATAAAAVACKKERANSNVKGRHGIPLERGLREERAHALASMNREPQASCSLLRSQLVGGVESNIAPVPLLWGGWCSADSAARHATKPSEIYTGPG